MATPHIESREDEISDLVLMPGDPLRAKYIADNFLEDVVIVNKVRNMTAYTGNYKGKRITVFPSGMGIPSMGIYAFELFKFYNVKKIIRIGTSGSLHKDIKLRDIVLSKGAFCRTFFNKLLDNNTDNYVESNVNLNNKIIDKAKEENINIRYGMTITSDVFDVYCDSIEEFEANFPDDDFLSVEMEAFALFYCARRFNREAACLMTVVDSKYDKSSLSSEDREKSLNDMITLALEAI